MENTSRGSAHTFSTVSPASAIGVSQRHMVDRFGDWVACPTSAMVWSDDLVINRIGGVASVGLFFRAASPSLMLSGGRRVWSNTDGGE